MDSISSNTFLSSCAGVVLAIASLGHSGDASAATIGVANCADAGPGSLRDGVAAAGSGDTVDLGSVGCTRIALTSGEIAVHQADLTIRGAGFRKITISGNSRSSVFRHDNPGGTLRLSGMRIVHGFRKASPASEGGCVYSSGNVSLYDVEVRYCRASGLRGPGTSQVPARGGGVFANGNVNIAYSGIYSNVVDGHNSYGGGIWASGKLTLNRTRVHHNEVDWEGGGFLTVGGLTMNDTTISDNRAGLGGGIYVFGPPGAPVEILNSTISDNFAGYAEGAFFILTSGARASVLITNTTVSGNESPLHGAGWIDAHQAYTSIVSSTIAFNRSSSEGSSTDPGALVARRLELESTIIANNSFDGLPGIDLSVQSSRVSGANNLVMLNYGVPLPADTLRDDPMLAPLSDNGGRTLTHALLEGSPAIDHGSNVANVPYDQRGVGFPRTNGVATDIGAFER